MKKQTEEQKQCVWKKNDHFELEITDISDEGAGIGRAGGLVWFIKDTLPGDHVEAAVTKLKKNYGFARLVRVLQPSADRVEPQCPIARQCGGCQLQAMSYEAQLRFKQEKVLNNLRRIGGFDIPAPAGISGEAADGAETGVGQGDATGAAELRADWENAAGAERENAVEADRENAAPSKILVEPIVGADSSFRYRNKAQFPIGRSRDGRIIAGFYAGRTHSIIECGDCLLGCEENQPILNCIIAWLEKWKLEPYNETNGSGLLRHVLIRKAQYTEELMVCLVVNAEQLPHENELVFALLGLKFESGAQIASISYNINLENTNVIMGTRLVNLYGPGYIEDGIRHLSIDEKRQFYAAEHEQPVWFHISPLAFYQVNPRQMERLYSTALDYAGLTGNEIVWDLYCGIGTISLFLAQRAKKVYGVEIIPQAIENARDNAKRNGISNAEFFVGKAEEVLSAWYAEQAASARDGKSGAEKECSGEFADVIVVDPPRKGCDEKCLETIVKIAPKRVVYVSCDSATLARDLKYLCANGYELKKVRAHDLFANSVHVECVVLMSRITK